MYYCVLLYVIMYYYVLLCIIIYYFVFLCIPENMKYPINNVEDFIVFLDLKVFSSDDSFVFSCSNKSASSFCRENNQFLALKHCYLNHTWISQSVKG